MTNRARSDRDLITLDREPQASGIDWDFIIIGGIFFTMMMLLILLTYRNTFRSLESQRKIFAAKFDGRRTVFFNEYLWSFNEAEARYIAWQCSYIELSPAYSSSKRYLRFAPPTRPARRG